MQSIRTVFFLGLLTGVLLFCGFFLGGKSGLMIAFFLSLGMNVFAYYFSGDMALKMYNAQEILYHNSPEIHTMVEELSRNARIPKPKIYLAHMGVANAFATGRDPEHASIALTREIIDLLTKEELRGVVAHEIAHIANRDILISSIAAVLGGAISMVANMAMFSHDNNRGNIITSLLFMIVAPLAATLIQMAVSRSREFMADELGAKISHSPLGLADALSKLENSATLSHVTSHDVNPATAHMMIINPLKGESFASLFSTHPQTHQRIERLRHLARQMGQM